LNSKTANSINETTIQLEGIDPLNFFGDNNLKFQIIRKAFPDLQFNTRGNTIRISGDDRSLSFAKEKIELMIQMLKENHELSTQTVEDLVNGENPLEHRLSDQHPNNTIVHGRDGKPIKAKTKNQKKLVTLSYKNDIVFAIGPAGTGKTYTAVALAVQALKNKTVKKIILTRPAVEAGESLGFLPGDMKEKVDPYLRPLYDALDDMIPAEKLKFFMENRTIEVAPLAFMRGRTLDNSFIILDEAQNCTSTQIKMFLTRLGPSAKCIITGDLSQIDLPYHQKSGLTRALALLSNIDGIGRVDLTEEDVVRHRLVKEIIKKYKESDDILREEYELKKSEKEKEKKERREQRENENI
jgi:phosphate starvation-inducible protein PhoH and related proteins